MRKGTLMGGTAIALLGAAGHDNAGVDVIFDAESCPTEFGAVARGGCEVRERCQG